MAGVGNCTESQCKGARAEGEHCLAHLRSHEFEALVERLRQGEELNASRARVSARRLSQLIDALHREHAEDRPQLPGPAKFEGAEFLDGAQFGFVDFGGDVSFSGARFAGNAHFTRSRFAGIAKFDGVEFDTADFFEAEFGASASFSRSRFHGDSAFLSAKFRKDADFHRVRFDSTAQFNNATFAAAVYFYEARFDEVAHFLGTTFLAGGSFSSATFLAPANFVSCNWHKTWFENTRFAKPVLIWLNVTAREFVISGARFEDECVITVATPRLEANRVRFGGRTEIGARWAEIGLEEAIFLRGGRLFRAEMEFEDDSAAHSQPVEEHRQESTPRLMTLKRADVAHLALDGLDLRACQFDGAYGLDQMRLEANCEFGYPPPLLRYSRRRILAEEHHWRIGQGWNPPACQRIRHSFGRDASEPLQPAHIAAVYRALRKAYEDRKDEPGAADFYYGEMEMRRHTGREPGGGLSGLARFWGERAILDAYWLVAGYGLRASRAVSWLVLLVLVGAVLLSDSGFVANRDHPPAALFSLESTVSLLHAPYAHLTIGGELIQIALRLLGPLLLGLMLLSLRGRVKR